MSTKDDNVGILITNLKNLLQEKMWLLEERLKKKRLISPYKELTDAQARILATLRGEALTISEIARRLNVSRQAVHKIVSTLVDAHLLKLQPIPDNARDKQIVFTKKGEAMKKEAAIALKELEHEVEAKIGRNNLKKLKQLLQKNW